MAISRNFSSIVDRTVEELRDEDCAKLVGGMQEDNNTKPLDLAAIARFRTPVGNEYSFHIIDPLTRVPNNCRTLGESVSCAVISAPRLYFQSHETS